MPADRTAPPGGAPARCLVCGGAQLSRVDVLPAALAEAWALAPDEVAYVNRQQGFHCLACGSTLRCMVLARALQRLYDAVPPFAEFAAGPRARALRVLEINEAGGLSRYLARLPFRTLAAFPAVDMQALPYADRSFDLVVHSDTLEHVPDPLAGMAECRRVLRDGGACAFTVPMIVGRLTQSRAGKPASFHGTAADGEGYRVHTEFGADAWRTALAAGFAECRVVALDAPAAHAFVAIR